MSHFRHHSFLLFLLAELLIAAPGFGKEPPTDYQCFFSESPIAIDGRADEDAWKLAKTVNDFSMPWVSKGSDKPQTATRAKLLWDREFLYFFGEMDDSDVYADVTEHDGVTWNNDVLELFFKPADDKPGYYEFQVNAANTTMDVFMPRRGDGGYDRFKAADEFDFKTAVLIRGTLNKRSDRDTGWSAEGRLAWKDFPHTGGRPVPGQRWKFALCRYDYSVDFKEPVLSTSAPLKVRNFHAFEDYAPIQFVGPNDSPKPQAAKPFGIERRIALTTSRVAGSPDPPHPYTVERIFEKLPIECPVTIAKQPGSDLVWIVTQPLPYAPTTLSRYKNAPEAADLETLIKATDDCVMYDISFHPKFVENGFVYIGSNGSFGGAKRSRVTRYYVDPQPPYKFAADSATTIIEWESDGHNGAALTFGLDGMMYVTSGDGTSDSDQNLRGQDLTQLTAKVLRIDVDHVEAGKTYRIPADNPFVDQKNVRPETWAYGLRNPWRIAVDPNEGHVWVGNNGQDLWEQVYLIERGANYGWSIVEGGHDFYPDRTRGPHPISKPIADHPHSEARSLTGGIVYYGEKLSELNGAYLYADYSTGKIWAIKHDRHRTTWHQEIADTPMQITAFANGNDGDVWVLDHGGKAIYRLVPTPADAPQPSFPLKLSESGLFKDVAGHAMSDGVIPYSVNAQLWSDGAYKERFLAIPHKEHDDQTIGYTGSNGWNFPNGTVIVKSFALDGTARDSGSHHWIETRFMVRQQNEWVGYSYAWNDEGTDASLVSREGMDRQFEIRDPAEPDGVRKQTWHFPSRTECMVCHSRAANFVLGLQTAQMNRDHDYEGVADNQLRTLEHIGLIQVDGSGEHPQKSSLLPRTPEQLPRLADPMDSHASFEARARSYLHSNCAHCHVAAGGGNANINLHIDTPLEKMLLIDQKPSHHTFGLTEAKIVASGAPDRSVLLHRISIRGSGQMPQLATSIVDREAVELLRAWIASLSKKQDEAP